MKLSITFLKSIYGVRETITKINETQADYIHVDVMDGLFVANKTPIDEELINCLKSASKPLDVHLMVKNPLSYLPLFKNLKIEDFIIHYEANLNLMETIKAIKASNLKVGLAINPDTSLSEIESFLSIIDIVLVMSVIPGKGGQTFMKSVIPKLKELKKLRVNKLYHYEISIDGGINDQTINLIKDDVDIVCVGSYVTMQKDYQQAVEKLLGIK